ncbi:fumarylacetoacetate hydrolase family protein [Salisediminibacterium halotolerans]|uniref:fumarylacetoacetate hydrolase family protein n=1 Tax=Salisediminibacterium halotolerans TaxID=517425 RepID=UPI000FBBE71B|nr:fumarylacetoacetate hydrolase family protein [Salisediminibacterium halotolerans]RPE83916.1 2-keto-4-pentenoate hydratase/2-oxohepta-3-ene-1,7-dioic acid hydratase in catechol pathway [Salisediminibacterium halotolerans]GEL09260.1 fumarylacetoacetate hydrolase [Salisediminibacterium halotolerans]
MDVKNIYCVGKNYTKHAEELGSTVPEEPLIFSKPTHSLIKADACHIPLPNDKGAVDYEAEIIIQLSSEYDAAAGAESCIAAMGLGIDFTLRDEQNKLRQEGHPWLTSKGFPNSAAVTDFFPFPGENVMNSSEFSLEINGEIAQIGDPKDMVYKLDDILVHCQQRLGLGAGDLIFTGTPEGVGPVKHGDHLRLLWNGEELGSLTVALV